MANDQPWVSGAWARIALVQIKARGHPLSHSGLIGCFSGQHGISAAIFIPAMALVIPSVIAVPEDAMALPASPMLIGPITIANSAASRHRR
ncbi:hypothetical protein ACU8OQ_12250 [Rhizobium leguminosarum]